ncbi:hypothetical protein HYW75_02120 [Candidatus Pacearchaeota archaeon]|nr:hypothetical protein [Candidatus Pacearchaeota archaeon]
MDRKTLTAVIVTALVVAVLASVITVKLTGNAVFGIKTTAKKTTYYTKDEIDTMISFIYTKREVDKLQNDLFSNPSGINVTKVKTGRDALNYQFRGDLDSESLGFTKINTEDSWINFVDRTSISLEDIWNLNSEERTQFYLRKDELSLERASTGPFSMSGILNYDSKTRLNPRGLSFSWIDGGKKYSFNCKPDKTGVFKCLPL